jgi:hypothetical protein
MSEIGVLTVRAPSLQKLHRQLEKRLARYAPEDIVSVSHSSDAVSARHRGGVWSGARTTQKLEYSAIVLLREHSAP